MLGKNIKENYYLLSQQNSNFTSSFYSLEFVHSFLAINAKKWAKDFNSGAQSLALAEVQLDDCLGPPGNKVVLVFYVFSIWIQLT